MLHCFRATWFLSVFEFFTVGFFFSALFFLTVKGGGRIRIFHLLLDTTYRTNIIQHKAVKNNNYFVWVSLKIHIQAKPTSQRKDSWLDLGRFLAVRVCHGWLWLPSHVVTRFACCLLLKNRETQIIRNEQILISYYFLLTNSLETREYKALTNIAFEKSKKLKI